MDLDQQENKMKVFKSNASIKSGRDKVQIEEIELPEGSRPQVLIKLKSMEQLLTEYDCWFDKHGNLCCEHGHTTPSNFHELGHEIHVNKGCVFDIDCQWLKET